MIELYSTGVVVTGSATIEWAKKPIQLGRSATLNADKKTINLNLPGVYEIAVNAYGETTAADSLVFQLKGDGVDIERGAAQTDTAAGDYGSVSFSLLVGVSAEIANTDKAALTLEYMGGAGTIELVNIVVKKVA